MFALKQCGEIRSDETAPYEVILDKEYTVQEFIEEVLKRTYEWGNIGINDGNRSHYFGNPTCEFNHGILSGTLPGYLDKKVKSAIADGGWTCMTYLLEVENA